MAHNNNIDWSEGFDGFGRKLDEIYRKSSDSWSKCYKDEVWVDCESGEPVYIFPEWAIWTIIGVPCGIAIIIMWIIATKKCKKSFKWARLIKCCKKNDKDAMCCD